MKKVQVAVIGAGLSGLSTAYRLHLKGYDVHVYEARARVGGRVFSAHVQGDVCELGAYNVYDGGCSRYLLGLIEEMDLGIEKHQRKLDMRFYNNNEWVAQQETKASTLGPSQLQEKLKDLAKDVPSLGDVLRGVLSIEDPMYEVVATKIAAYEGAHPDELSSFYTDTLYYSLLGGISYAHQLNEHKEYLLQGSVKGGNSQLPRRLSEKLKGAVHLEHTLQSVSRSDSKYSLIFSQNERVECDILVFAIPATVYSHIKFDLGQAFDHQVQSYSHIQYGTNAKLITSLKDSSKATFQTVDPGFVSFKNSDTSLLVLYQVGKNSFFDENSIAEVYKGNVQVLKTAFGSYALSENLPKHAKDKMLVSYLEKTIGYSWPNDPLVCGSYSYIGRNQQDWLLEQCEVLGENVRKAFAPIDQRIFFVGEHTTILEDVMATMEAACESGERAARMIERVLTYRANC